MAKATAGQAAADEGQLASDDNSRAFAAISYIFGIIIAALIYLLKKEKEYVRFHAMQAVLLDLVLLVFNLALLIVLLAIAFVLGLASGGIGFFGGFILIYVLFFAWSLALLAIRLFLAWKAYHGERFLLPLVGSHAARMTASAS